MSATGAADELQSALAQAGYKQHEADSLLARYADALPVDPPIDAVRREALEWAVRTCSHAATAGEVTRQAEVFLTYLRGAP